MRNWFDISATEATAIGLSLIAMYGLVIILTRIFGLRSFSKMSAADFAMTIAVGTILGGAIANPSPSVLVAALALTGLFAGQLVIARLRRASDRFRQALDNDPVYLMKDGALLHDNLVATGVSPADVRAKLREANVTQLKDVAAVVFETTGDVSVLHGACLSDVDSFILDDVEGAPLQQS